MLLVENECDYYEIYWEEVGYTVEEEEQDHCRMNFHHICFYFKSHVKTLQKLNTTKHVGKYDM